MQTCWEAAWLAYRSPADANRISIFCSAEEDAVLARAKEELALAAGELPEGTRIRLELAESLEREAYRFHITAPEIRIAGGSTTGLLYGVFGLLRRMRMGASADGCYEEAPKNPLRMLNHWDNIDGSIERGYSGRSFFFSDGQVLSGERIKTYARLCASVGINGVVLNNVNVRQRATDLITEEYLPRVREIADVLASYGIKTFLSVNFAAPMELGGLPLADPLDERVEAYWRRQVGIVYREIPEFGGFLVKADSEGRPGPFTYGRTHADGANLLARCLQPYGGLVIWRCFVYNCTQDWRDTKTDRARAGYDHFAPLDGQFLPNVILQIKNGPMDFQVREPVSPLFGGMTRTNQMLEVQAAQEYTGQQRHVCYLIPMWKEILSFRTYVTKKDDTVADIVAGRTFGQKNCGMCAVANTGDDPNWTGHDLAAANWYGFGRLAWDTELSAEEIAAEWIGQTFGTEPQLRKAIGGILLGSWRAYENYTSPLGIGWMVNPSHHYGPNVEGYEYDRWGTYHRATRTAIGVERSSRGTGYAAQYREPNASMYEHPETTPEELLLFFHRIPYDYRLKDGRTLLQYIYDTHFEGVEQVKRMLAAWDSCRELLDEKRFARVRARLEEQLESAVEWRDRINTYFYRMTEQPDAQGRVIY
ncbi:MAG: alpha-glucuronidase [Lachnospiraceae bacterium]|nr:alpha-glucuronidase [Lachnospiraceae bacterium]